MKRIDQGVRCKFPLFTWLPGKGNREEVSGVPGMGADCFAPIAFGGVGGLTCQGGGKEPQGRSG